MAEISAAGDAPRSSPSTHKEDARNSTSQTRKPPLISLAILRRAIGNEIASLPVDEVSRRVYAGVLLKDDKKQGEDQEQPYTHKYWVDKDLNKSCWMVLAKALSMPPVSNLQSWKWTEEEEACFSGNIKLPVIELTEVWRLDIQGKCKTILLSPRTTYQVEILVKRTRESYILLGRVELSLALPDGNRVGRSEILRELKREKWIPIRIGKFETTPKTVGEVSFSVGLGYGPYGSWGLCVKGVVFRPTASTTREED